MRKLPQVGDKWGTLEVIERLSVYEPNAGYPITVLIAKCKCGNKLRINSHNWLGRNKMPDCGCGSGPRQKVTLLISTAVHSKIVQLSLNMDQSVEQVTKMIFDSGLTMIDIDPTGGTADDT